MRCARPLPFHQRDRAGAIRVEFVLSGAVPNYRLVIYIYIYNQKTSLASLQRFWGEVQDTTGPICKHRCSQESLKDDIFRDAIKSNSENGQMVDASCGVFGIWKSI